MDFETAYNRTFAGRTVDTRHMADCDEIWRAAVAAERDRAARVCDDEARIRTEAGNTHPEDSESRSRCFAGARAAINCAKGVRGGEVVGPNTIYGNPPSTIP